MRTSTLLLVLLLSTLILVPRAHAQTSHAATQSAMDAAVQEHVASTASDREDVLRVLNLPQVKAVAGQAGLDLRKATTAVATLDGDDLKAASAQARQVERTLAGGQSKIVLSTTVIIIALLVLILLIVAID
ncbi:MAG TPA: hypothetical protein VFB85_12300 [Vicinamibacterales bacterium]|jgi:hypothetical protein|nr:hypothetical protein [Vicinamibacterales bacterium]